MSDQNKMSFEEALLKLEEIVLQLEKEDVPLEKAIDYYQEGMKLSKLCDEMLRNAEDKMTQILNEKEELEPFDMGEES